MSIKSCCFTGHRPKLLPWKDNENDLRCIALKSKIRFEVEDLIVNHGCERFISGMAQGIDMIGAEIILALKNIYPHIKLECAVPNHAFAKNWSAEYAIRYSSILTRADYRTFISDKKVYSVSDLMLRNKYMVDNSDIIIAVYNVNESGGTRNTIDYAESKNKKVRRILLE